MKPKAMIVTLCGLLFASAGGAWAADERPAAAADSATKAAKEEPKATPKKVARHSHTEWKSGTPDRPGKQAQAAATQSKAPESDPTKVVKQ